MKYKVFFYRGNELNLKTKALKGYAWLDESGLHIDGAESFIIPIGEVLKARLFRLHGLGRVIQIECAHGRLFVSVIRLMVGQFAFINFFKTGRLYKSLLAITGRKS